MQTHLSREKLGVSKMQTTSWNRNVSAMMKKSAGNSLAVQCLELRTLTAKGPGSIPGRGTKIPQAVGCGQKEKKLQKKSADE